VAAGVLFVLVEGLVFGQSRYNPATSYNAMFTNVNGLRNGNFVRVAGVEVGKVTGITVNPDATVLVKFGADPKVALTETTGAQIRYDDLIGGRYLQITEGAPGARRLHSGQTIPVSRTKPPLDLDAVTGGFRPLLQGVNPDQLNALSNQLMTAFVGEGPTLQLLLGQASVVTNTLADRDLLIGEVVTNLDVVLGTLGPQGDQLDKAITSFSSLVSALAARKSDISGALAQVNAASGSVADLLRQAREPFKNVVHQTDRLSENLLAQGEYLDQVLDQLPDTFQALLRQGMYGDYFQFYVCNAMLKLNGKTGEPTYLPLTRQFTGRCLPR
jgi:phospholipid/cholesterol/gamma-HCH transport system substrate-binding protein